MPFSRAVAPFPVHGEGLHLAVAQANPFSGVAKLFGRQEIEVGDAAFDRAFVVKGSVPNQVIALLGGEPGIPLRKTLEHLPEITLGISDEGREATAFAGGAEATLAGTDVVYAVRGASSCPMRQ